MILYTLKKYVNEKLSAANGKFFAKERTFDPGEMI